eukprot:4583584-Lingulodinium_polyedra.AAC.1
MVHAVQGLTVEGLEGGADSPGHSQALRGRALRAWQRSQVALQGSHCQRPFAVEGHQQPRREADAPMGALRQ